MNTTRKYRIHVSVELPMSHERYAYNLELEPEFHRELRPIKTCDDDMPVMLQMATGELTKDQAFPRREDRKNLARRLAAEISEKLVEAMGRDDTHNGYSQNDQM